MIAADMHSWVVPSGIFQLSLVCKQENQATLRAPVHEQSFEHLL